MYLLLTEHVGAAWDWASIALPCLGDQNSAGRQILPKQPNTLPRSHSLFVPPFPFGLAPALWALPGWFSELGDLVPTGCELVASIVPDPGACRVDVSRQGLLAQTACPQRADLNGSVLQMEK